MDDENIDFSYNLHYDILKKEFIFEKKHPSSDWSVNEINIFILNDLINLLKKWGYLDIKESK